MKTAKVQEYKKRLEEERRELIAKIGHDQADDFGSDIDEDEEADEAEAKGEKLAADNALRERINEIDMALAKIVEGKFGVCVNCEKEIEEEILKISPESALCKACKTSNR